MELRRWLVERKGTILERWFGAVVRTYPADAREFLHRDSERFANPVGATTRRALGGILDGLASEDPQAACAGPLNDVLRIRAVQDFAPSGAVGFVQELKRILREDLAEAGMRDVPDASLAAWDEWVDRLTLMAFDAYVAFRLQVVELRAAEWKNRMSRLLQLAGLVGGADDAGGEARDERDPAAERSPAGEAEGLDDRPSEASPAAAGRSPTSERGGS